MVKYVDDATVSDDGGYPKLEMDGMVSTMTTNLHGDADLCVKWSKENSLGLNTQLLDPRTIGVILQKSSRNTSNYIKISGESIRRVNGAKLLGITVSSDLTLGNHINDIYNRAAR